MATYTLPNTQTGGSQQINASSLQDAKNQAQAAGTWSPAAGTYGANSLPSGGDGGGGTPSGGGTGANLQAGQLLLQQAQNAAYQAYLNAKLALDTDQEAYQKAAQQAATLIAQAGVTGTFNGQPTQAAVKQAADIAAQQAQTMMGYAQQFGSWGTPTQGQQTLAANQQAYNQWLQGQQLALSQWQAQQGAAQNYLQLMAGLRGPADWAQYQTVLGATPGGMKDLVAAAAGQYIPGGGATTGTQPQPVNLNNFVGQVTGSGNPQDLQNAQNTLVAPNQMAPQTWNALQPSQQQMLLGIWQSQGYTQQDAQNLFNQSLPKYATSSPQAGAFRLQ